MRMHKKYKWLLLSILFDAIGMVSFIIPGIGEFSDVIWAPVSVYIITKMYKGTIGKVGGAISFLEEIGIFGTDFLPTFTLTWVYYFLIKKES